MVPKYHLMKPPQKPRRAKQSWRKRLREEDGRILLLGLGTCVLLSTLILMTMSISGIYLEQRRLQRVADQTVSLAVAEVEDTIYYQQGTVEGAPIPIDQAGARQRAGDYLAKLDSRLTPGLENITITKFHSDATRVELELSASGKIPLLVPLVTDLTEVSLRVKSSAGLKTTFG